MVKFSYKAKEGPGKIVDGTVEASNVDNAISKVIQLGLSPIDVSEAAVQNVQEKKKVSIAHLPFFNRIKLTDIVVFTRQLSDLIEASVPMLRALQIVSQQTANLELKKMINTMYEFVRDGGAFSEALAQHKKYFSTLYINLIRTGEVSGQLEIVLNRLADYLDKEQETQSKVRSSLAYPALILIVGILTVFVLLTFVIPRLTVMFDDFNQDLPLVTLFLINISSFFAQFWWIMVISITGGIVYLKKWFQSEKGRLWFDSTIIKLPIFGYFIKVVEIGRFCRTLGTLLESGVVITTALNSVWATVNNQVLRNEIKQVSEDVTNGASLRGALKSCSFFPEIAVNMISVGEETGNLEKSLLKIADTFERQADQTIKTLVSLIGPIVLVFIVSIVGVVVIAMLLPIFQMNLLIS